MKFVFLNEPILEWGQLATFRQNWRVEGYPIYAFLFPCSKHETYVPVFVSTSGELWL